MPRLDTAHSAAETQSQFQHEQQKQSEHEVAEVDVINRAEESGDATSRTPRLQL